ncbi:type I methionyl aminopeptidase [Clostridiaceae bacterium]|jgi:methionyl aminopeptidase|uniref:type I methionyl aminopeptidase n=1 Tax=Luoshenia tenuis TaxID=2763654 RepID=UPI000820D46A|nr:Methionine aminopeptidase 1 [uncultured Clostridium sp.]
MIEIKTREEIAHMRAAGLIAAKARQAVGQAVAPGVTTAELEKIAEDTIRSCGAIPSFKGYEGFPYAICASTNEEVVHGFPSQRVLQEGDIFSADIGTIYEGWQGDTAETFPVGKVSKEAQALIEVTEASFWEAVKFCKVGYRLGDISYAVQQYCESRGYGVVRDLCGHGIGREMHEDPEVPNFGRPGKGPRLQEGMVIAIEPMITTGTYRVRVRPDGWTVVTADGSLASHYEHTVAITDGEPEILTAL